ncbi:hypothetical protein BX666DRAFT_2059556 [Dichotomocladium elegans]|nr:hypothetical protein BX666DRAFT_2059556 [Dichotomocladium elegans]
MDYSINLPDPLHLEVSKLVTALSMSKTMTDKTIFNVMVIIASLSYGQCRLLSGLTNM